MLNRHNNGNLDLPVTSKLQGRPISAIIELLKQCMTSREHNILTKIPWPGVPQIKRSPQLRYPLSNISP